MMWYKLTGMNTANDSGTSDIPAMPNTIPISWGENPSPPIRTKW